MPDPLEKHMDQVAAERARRKLYEATREAVRLRAELDNLNTEFAEVRAERDAARAVPEELRQFSEVAHKGRLVFSDIYDQRFARAAATWVRALIATPAASALPDTPVASGQAGDPLRGDR